MNNNIIINEINELNELLKCYQEFNNFVYSQKEKISFEDIKNKWQMFKLLKEDNKYTFNISVEVKYIILSIYYYLQPINNNDLIECKKSNISGNKLYLTNEIIELPNELLEIINNFLNNSKQDFLIPQLKLYQNNIYKPMKINNFISLIKTIFPNKQCSLCSLKQIISKKF